MNKPQRNYFAFFYSFFEAIEELPKKYQLQVYRAIALYGLMGEEDPSLHGTPKALYISLKPVLDKNRTKSENAANAKRSTDKTVAKGMRITSEKEAVSRNEASEAGTVEQRTVGNDMHKREYTNNPNISSPVSSKANFKGKNNDAILRDDSPNKYDNDQAW